MALPPIVTGDPLLAARDAEESITFEPYHEIGYQWLMRAQAAASKRGEAVRAFRRCRERVHWRPAAVSARGQRPRSG